MKSEMRALALFGILATAACGGTVVFESDGGGDGGGNGDGGRDGTTLAASTTASASTGVVTTTGGGGGSTSVGSTVGVAVSSSVAASAVAVSAVAVSSGQGGSPSNAPCANACFGDPGCDVVPPSPGDACATCVQQEIARATESECAVAGALGPCCQEIQDCAEYVNCVLGGSRECDAEFPSGAARAEQCIYATCGDCGEPVGPA